MSKINFYKIRQYINGRLFFYTQFRSSYEDYQAFKSLLLFPKKDEIVDKADILNFTIEDKKTHIKRSFFNLVLDVDKYPRNSEFIFSALKGRNYDGINVDIMHIYNWRFDFPLPNYLKKGNDYEKHISRYFSSKGYDVIENFSKGTEDEGIDIIAIKEKELLLIQCKNWQVPLVTQKEIKEFLGSCYLFLYNYPQYRNYKVRRIFVSSSNELSSSASNLLESNKPFIEFFYKPFSKKI